MRALLLSLICLFAGISHPLHLEGAQTISGETVTIDKRVADDLYIAAGEITINAVVEGDIVVAGGQVYINDSVRQDVIVTGGQVTISGHVGDDIRVAGGNVTLKGSAGGDVLAFAGSLDLEKSSTIYGDLIAYAGSVDMAATIRGDARIMGGDIEISGSILGNLDARGGDILMKGMVAKDAILSADDLSVEEPAQFSGSLSYWSGDGEHDLMPFMITGKPEFDPDLEYDYDIQWQYLGLGVLLYWFLSILSALIIILILVLGFPQWMKRTGEDTKRNWWKHILFGLGFAVGVPVVTGILFITIIGIPIAFLLMFFYGFVVLYGTTFGAIALASFLAGQIGREWNKLLVLVLAIAFMIILKVIGLIPFLGWLVTFVAGLYGVGALISNIRTDRQPPLPGKEA